MYLLRSARRRAAQGRPRAGSQGRRSAGPAGSGNHNRGVDSDALQTDAHEVVVTRCEKGAPRLKPAGPRTTAGGRLAWGLARAAAGNRHRRPSQRRWVARCATTPPSADTRIIRTRHKASALSPGCRRFAHAFGAEHAHQPHAAGGFCSNVRLQSVRGVRSVSRPPSEGGQGVPWHRQCRPLQPEVPLRRGHACPAAAPTAYHPCSPR